MIYGMRNLKRIALVNLHCVVSVLDGLFSRTIASCEDFGCSITSSNSILENIANTIKRTHITLLHFPSCQAFSNSCIHMYLSSSVVFLLSLGPVLGISI